jgi:hypothetical protein
VAHGEKQLKEPDLIEITPIAQVEKSSLSVIESCRFRIPRMEQPPPSLRAYGAENSQERDKHEQPLASVTRSVSAPVVSDGEYDDPSDTDDDSTDDPDEQFLDVDLRHMGEPGKLAKYAERILKIARDEIPGTSVSSSGILSMQTSIAAPEREEAIGFIFRLQQRYEMSNNTLYQAVACLNIALSAKPFTRDELLLAAFTITWIAAKLEESDEIPKLDRLSALASRRFSEDDFVQCERELLALLDFRLTFPTTKLFSRRLLDVIDAEEDVREVAAFFTDLSLLPIEMVDFPPDIVALACVCLAKLSLSEFCPTKRLMAYANISNIVDAQNCCRILILRAIQVREDPANILYVRYTEPPMSQYILRLDLSEDLATKF